MNDVALELEQARTFFLRRDYSAAIDRCRVILTLEPRHGDAHELLGISCMTLGKVVDGISHLRQSVAHSTGKLSPLVNLAQALVGNGQAEEGAALLRNAIESSGPSPDLYYHLAVAQQAARDTTRAIDSYRQCVRLNPEFAEAHNNLGVALDRMGRIEESMTCFRAALHAKPCYVRALSNLGNALRKMARYPEAVETLNQVLALAPEFPAALCNLGQVMLDQHRPQEAATLYRRALALEARIPEAHYGLGTALYLSGDYRQALASLDTAIELAPGHKDGYLYRGRTLLELDRHAEALASYERALELEPQSADAWVGRGLALGLLRRFDQAIGSYEAALEFSPDLAAARWNQALLRLTLGDFQNGWKLFESRFEIAESRDRGIAECRVPARATSFPRWRGGASVRGKSIWVTAEPGEPGFGDTIQFCRYVKRLDELGANVIFEVRPALLALMRTLGPGPRLIAQGDPVEFADYECPLMSLPLAFGTEARNIPAEASYLSVDASRIAAWGARVGSGSLRIGIAWRGNAGHDKWELKGRSMALSYFQELLRVPGIRMIALQKGSGTEELADVSFGGQIVSFGDSLDPGSDAFLDTAAVMMNLDLVITVDTAIAHLAGALGIPVWVALNSPSDWRWQLNREDSPWYPRMRLFRQSRPGDWTGVMESMAAKLAQFSVDR